MRLTRLRHADPTLCVARFLSRTAVPLVSLGLLIGAASPTQAALIVTMEEVGAHVLVSGSGTANLTDLNLVLNASALAVVGSGVFLGADPSQAFAVDVYEELSGPHLLPGVSTIASSGTGDRFGVLSPFRLVVPDGYVSGAPLSATSVYAGATLASLGITPGTYVWTWGTGANADSFTLQVGPASVPEPISLTLLGVGLAGVAMRRQRTGKVTSTSHA